MGENVKREKLHPALQGLPRAEMSMRDVVDELYARRTPGQIIARLAVSAAITDLDTDRLGQMTDDETLVKLMALADAKMETISVRIMRLAETMDQKHVTPGMMDALAIAHAAMSNLMARCHDVEMDSEAAKETLLKMMTDDL